MMDELQKKNFIISADDFGKSKLANKNILLLAKAGKLDRVSVMADGNFVRGELKELLETGVKIDIHLHLGNRLENRKRVKESFARRSLIFLTNYLLGVINKKSVKRKWDRQIEEFVKLMGRKPEGVNAHRYDHFFPVYFPLVLELAKKHGIERVRFGKILFADGDFLVPGILNFFWKRNKKKFSNSRLKSCDYCLNLDWIRNPQSFLKNLPNGEVELIIHPERKEEYDFVSNLAW